MLLVLVTFGKRTFFKTLLVPYQGGLFRECVPSQGSTPLPLKSLLFLNKIIKLRHAPKNLFYNTILCIVAPVLSTGSKEIFMGGGVGAQGTCLLKRRVCLSTPSLSILEQFIEFITVPTITIDSFSSYRQFQFLQIVLVDQRFIAQ